ncbi:hypothetical protein BD410DRAFT_893266 [Rickenella mellea]|uniref:F-box domain-containing protein n=1 Tax=Rickenella mellea TaxID=50990 RepID=A0A4R5XHI1_9AGAM|nr:hypothetical protein BD410DRAFT_893266 [Rickenella mellea]
MEEDDALSANNVSDWADLVQAFSKMQNDFPEPLKSNDGLSSPPIPNLNELTWSRTYRALCAQKDIQARLLQEMQRVEARISFLQMSCNKLALRRAVRLLPDEILAMIFEAGYTSDLEGNQFAVSISHVNKRFRNISLELPRLWSTISNYQGISELDEYLARSKQAAFLSSYWRRIAQPLPQPIFSSL